jgi:hypothetical protein
MKTFGLLAVAGLLMLQLSTADMRSGLFANHSFAATAAAQEGGEKAPAVPVPDVDIDVVEGERTTTTWVVDPTVLVAGGIVLLIILLIALASRGGGTTIVRER